MLAKKGTTSFSFFEVYYLPLNRYKYLSADVLLIQFTKEHTRAMFDRLLLSLPPIDIKAGTLLFTGCIQTCAFLQFFKPDVSRSNECLKDQAFFRTRLPLNLSNVSLFLLPLTHLFISLPLSCSLSLSLSLSLSPSPLSLLSLSHHY